MFWINCSRKKNGKLVTENWKLKKCNRKLKPRKTVPLSQLHVHVWICYRRKGATDWDWDMCRSRSESVKNEGFSRFMTNLVIQKAGTKSVLHPCQKILCGALCKWNSSMSRQEWMSVNDRSVSHEFYEQHEKRHGRRIVKHCQKSEHVLWLKDRTCQSIKRAEPVWMGKVPKTLQCMLFTLWSVEV